MVKQMQICLSIAAFGVATAAGAESLGQKKAREHALQNEEHDIKVVATSCGSEIKMSFDWDTFDGTFDATHTESTAASFCGMVFNGVGQICRESKDGKEAVAKTLKEVRCSYDKDVTPKAKFDLKGGVLHVTTSYRMNSVDSDAKKYMMDHL
jgi:hypothetical protein